MDDDLSAQIKPDDSVSQDDEENEEDVKVDLLRKRPANPFKKKKRTEAPKKPEVPKKHQVPGRRRRQKVHRFR